MPICPLSLLLNSAVKIMWIDQPKQAGTTGIEPVTPTVSRPLLASTWRLIHKPSGRSASSEPDGSPAER